MAPYHAQFAAYLLPKQFPSLMSHQLLIHLAVVDDEEPLTVRYEEED